MIDCTRILRKINCCIENSLDLGSHHFIDHALVKLVDSIFDQFNERKHTIVISANL